MLTHHSIDVVVRDFATPAPPHRILVVKLDHLGDFIIGLPALEQLREAFPHSLIRLVCGPWNRDLAIATGLVDEVRTYTYFPQNARDWDGRPCDELSVFETAAHGPWDLAIDLRLDDDTRFLLGHVDARMRCGIGNRSRHGFLDILLPPEVEQRFNSTASFFPETRLELSCFTSHMPVKHATRHETRFRHTNRFLVTGPGMALPRGRFQVQFDCDIAGRGFGARGVALTFDAAANNMPVAERTLSGRSVSDLAGGPLSLEFTNNVEGARYDFRIHCRGRPLLGRLGFKGCRLRLMETPLVPRLRLVELHAGEKLSLLVCLIRERMQGACRALHIGQGGSAGLPRDYPGQQVIALAPISNSTLRDWPPDHYAGLVRLLLDRLDCQVVLLGSPDQQAPIAAMLAPVGAHPRLRNLAGIVPWPSVPALLKQADLVICNNSGIAHLAAAAGARTLAIYSASHEATEWGPRGPRSRVLTAKLACAPCGHDRLSSCLYQHACMQGITPEMVYREAAHMLDLPDPA